MRFARRLAAVLLLVGVIVALGLVWGHASGAGQDGFVFYGREGSGPGLSLSNSGDLIRTVELEALIMTVVITISAVRLRRRRHARRAAPEP
ncbi:MAG TPA: hypothetical protein VFV73_31440 [Streptosporangiaceae bacterium]|nr:hypothetical protein [Streptosporangiaceae bacterium]